MEYRRQSQPPGRRHERMNSDENHSVFDFPPSFTPSDRNGRSKASGRAIPRSSNAHGTPATHGYPSSISIQKSAGLEKRSPTTSPHQREADSFQHYSPNPSKTARVEASSEMEQHHIAGQIFFLRNRLSEAVDSYSHAIRVGLEELKQRNEMMTRLGSKRDGVIIELGEAIAQVHFDMGKALEVCAKYADAKEEYENGIGLLQNTCHKLNSDEMLRRALGDASRMEDGIRANDQRVRLQADLEAAMKKIETTPTAGAKESARVNAMECLKRLLRMECEAMGEKCYTVAKLKLKLAKLKCECGDIDNGLVDAESAIKTLKVVLGSMHALVGASCSFAASAYEKRVSIISCIPTTNSKSIEGLCADGKVMIDRALELYTDALDPMQFKYNEEDSMVRPNIGEVFHKIGRLYAKKGANISALETYQRSLEYFGDFDQGFHSDAVFVWHDLATLYLTSKDYLNAIDASNKSNELVKKAQSASRGKKFSERLETLTVWNYQTAGDAYSAASRFEEARRSYHDALGELKKSYSNSSNGLAVDPLAESRLLKKIGMTLLEQDKIADAKVFLTDALRVMRLVTDSDKSQDMPALMADIGAIYLKLQDYSAALPVLQECLKLFSDQGVSEYSVEFQKASDMFKAAQIQSNDLPHARHMAATTPRTQITAVTIPSPHSSSSRSTLSPRHLELEKDLNDELDQAKLKIARLTKENEARKIETSRMKEIQSTVSEEQDASLLLQLDCAKREIARLKEDHKQEEASKLREADTEIGLKDEVKSLSAQLEEKTSELSRLQGVQARDAVLLEQSEIGLKQALQQLQEVQAENIQLTAAVKAKTEMESKIETLRNQLSVSESSYQQILQAIDEEKEELSKTHDSKVRDLMNENSALRENLQHLNHNTEEVASLKEQSKKIAQENGLLKYDIRNLRNERETLATEVTALKKKLDEKSTEMSNDAVLAEKLRKTELELASEKRRRVILESSLDKEYDSLQMPMQPMPGYPMFGYPPMNMMGYGPDKGDKKVKLLEVDLAAERENIGILEKTVSELTAKLEQEKDNAKAHSESLMARHEREMNEVFLDLKKKEDDLAELSEIATQFHSVADELAVSKELLINKSKLADAFEHEHSLLEETREELSREKEVSATFKSDLTETQSSLQQKVHEYLELLDEHGHMTNMLENAKSEIEQLKTAMDKSAQDLEIERKGIEETQSSHQHEIARMEDAMIRTKSSHHKEMERLEKELSDSSHQLKEAKMELQDLHSIKDTTEREVQHLQQLADKQNKELIQAFTDNEALENNVESLRSISQKKNEELLQIQDQVKSLTMENSSLKIEIDRLQGKLTDIQEETAMSKEQLADLERVLDQMDSKLIATETELQERDLALKEAKENIDTIRREGNVREKDAELVYDKFTNLKSSFEKVVSSVLLKFEKLLPEENSSTSVESLEEKTIRITTLATLISNEMKDKERQMEEVNFEMASTLRELDLLESKYKQTRMDLAASMDACKNEQELEHDYDELMRYCAGLENEVSKNQELKDQIHKLQNERKSQQEEITCLKQTMEQHVSDLQVIEEQRDVFQSRLKEAIDDLEELEHERNELRSDLEKTYTESMKLEKSLRVKIDCLEEENERLMHLEGDNITKGTELWDKDNRPKGLLSTSEGKHMRSYSMGELETYPDLLPSSVDVCDELASLRSIIKTLESRNMKLSENLAELQSGSQKSSTMNDTEVQTMESSIDTPSALPLSIENTLSLKTRLSELIDQNDELTRQIDQLKSEAYTQKAESDSARAHEKGQLLEEIGSLTEKVKHLQSLNEGLSAKVNNYQAELVKTAERDSEEIRSLKIEVEYLIEQNISLKNDLDELSSISHYDAKSTKDFPSENEGMLQEIASLRDHVQTLEEYNEDLSSQLVKLQEVVALIDSKEEDALVEETGHMESQINELKTSNAVLLAKLEERSKESADISQLEFKHHQEVASLRKALEEKDASIRDHCRKVLDEQKQLHQAELKAFKTQLCTEEKNSDIHDNCKKALDEQKLQHQGELESLKSQLYQLEDCNSANQEEMSLLQIDLKNALKDCNDHEIRHQQELSTVNMEFTNALNSLEKLQKENKRLRLDIQSLSTLSKGSFHGEPSDENAYFEKEISAAHSRFVSMERSLQDRIERLEGEKFRLIAIHKDEIEKKDVEFERVRVELTAWKLEMQNALNDIEGLKREKKGLEEQVAIYKASLDALDNTNETADCIEELT